MNEHEKEEIELAIKQAMNSPRMKAELGHIGARCGADWEDKLRDEIRACCANVAQSAYELGHEAGKGECGL